MTALASPISSTLRTRRHVRIGTILTTLFLLVLAVLAVFGAALAPHAPDATNLTVGIRGPGDGFLLGTDSLGEDVLSRVLAGARSAIIGPALIAIGALVISNCLGLLAGFRAGRTDAIISRTVDIFMALPAFLVTIVIVGVVGGGYWTAVVLLTVLAVPYDVRVVRGATLEQRTRPYVEASITLGLNGRRVMATQIWPNIVSLVVANAFLDFAFSLVNLSGLSYLGLGSPPGSVDWGRMLADNQSNVLSNVWAALGPGLLIVITAVGMNLVGDWLADSVSRRGQGR